MKFKAWDESCKNDTEEFCYLDLVTFPISKDVGILIVDKFGNRINGGSVLYFNSLYRTIVTISHLNPDIPLKTDFKGYPIVAKDEDVEDDMRRIASDQLKDEMMQALAKKESTLQ